jgi:hypothetical protein
MKNHVARGEPYIETGSMYFYPIEGKEYNFSTANSAVWVGGKRYDTVALGPSRPINVAGKKIRILHVDGGNESWFAKIKFEVLDDEVKKNQSALADAITYEEITAACEREIRRWREPGVALSEKDRAYVARGIYTAWIATTLGRSEKWSADNERLAALMWDVQ